MRQGQPRGRAIDILRASKCSHGVAGQAANPASSAIRTSEDEHDDVPELSFLEAILWRQKAHSQITKASTAKIARDPLLLSAPKLSEVVSFNAQAICRRAFRLSVCS
jgi:hypothetical protein